MLEKIGNLAERLATNVSLSRRGFLSRLGQGALAVGAVLGGISTAAAAGSGGKGVTCCYYRCGTRPYYYYTDCRTGGNCPHPDDPRCRFIRKSRASDCSQC
jgi:hypothetical protein